jgi:hypothetical protein
MRVGISVLFLAARVCLAAEVQAPKIGLSDLEGVIRYPLEPGQKAGSVVIFYCHDCPVCNSYAPEINRLWARYTNFVFYVAQVEPDLPAAAAKEHARAYDLRPTVLLDPQHRLVKLAGVDVTPEAVVFGKEGQVFYRGRLDDWYAAVGERRAEARHHDLREALDAVGKGKRVKIPATEGVGCVIEK